MPAGIELILKYFPDLSVQQIDRLKQLAGAYFYWNEKINLISRKDISHLYEHHLLYSLSIAKFISFPAGSRVIDVGTGGGLPGLPMAILFPETRFHLIDSTGKKINVVKTIAESLELVNTTCQKIRAEEMKAHFDFILGRGVTRFPAFYMLTKHLLKPSGSSPEKKGIIYLKGGNTDDDLSTLPHPAIVVSVSDYFREPFFKTKKILFYHP